MDLTRSKREELQQGMDELTRPADRERYKVTQRVEVRVLARTTKHKPAGGSTHWSSRKLAAALAGDIP